MRAGEQSSLCTRVVRRRWSQEPPIDSNILCTTIANSSGPACSIDLRCMRRVGQPTKRFSRLTPLSIMWKAVAYHAYSTPPLASPMRVPEQSSNTSCDFLNPRGWATLSASAADPDRRLSFYSPSPSGLPSLGQTPALRIIFTQDVNYDSFSVHVSARLDKEMLSCLVCVECCSVAHKDRCAAAARG